MRTTRFTIADGSSAAQLVLQSLRIGEFFSSSRLEAERTIAKQAELEFEAFLRNQIYSLLNSHLIQI